MSIENLISSPDTLKRLAAQTVERYGALSIRIRNAIDDPHLTKEDVDLLNRVLNTSVQAGVALSEVIFAPDLAELSTERLGEAQMAITQIDVFADNVEILLSERDESDPQ